MLLHLFFLEPGLSTSPNTHACASVFSLTVMDVGGRHRQELRFPRTHYYNWWINGFQDLGEEPLTQERGMCGIKTSNDGALHASKTAASLLILKRAAPCLDSCL